MCWKCYLILVLVLLLSGCLINKSTNPYGNYVIKVGDKPVSREEFIYNLKKNNYNSGDTITREDIDEYLDLYINFKLKVYDAISVGMDTSESFINEFNTYKGQLTESYMKDDSIIHLLARKAYERLKSEINASHILVEVPNFSNPEDTLEAYRKIHRIYRLAQDQSDFNSLAIQYSDDPSVRNNKGNLGYFTALQLVYPFEEAAYQTSTGKVSKPFKSRFGYHILKVHDRRPSRGKIQVAHIMIRDKDSETAEDSLKSVRKIYALYDSLSSGGNWNYLCKKYSEDNNTRDNGGTLAPFGTGRIIPAFSEAAFTLNDPGDISEPVRTPYGWHIIKLIKKIPLEPYDNLKDDLINKIRQDSRADVSRKILLRRLKKENHFKSNDFIKDQIIHYADSSLTTGKWDYDTLDTFLDLLVFEIGKSQYAVKDFFAFVKKNQRPNVQASPDYYMNELLNKYIEKEMIQYEKDHLADKNFEYRMLVNEYREGILLFELMNQKVWNKAVEDSIGLQKFFEQNKNNYLWGKRIQATIFKTDNLETIDKIRHLLQKDYYYYDTLFFTIDWDSLKLSPEEPDLRKLDSLYIIAESNENIHLEFSFPENISGDLITGSLIDHHYDTSLFFTKAADIPNCRIRLVSIAKKDLNRLDNDNSIVNLHVSTDLYEQGDNEIIDMIEWEPGIHDLSIENDEYIVYVNEIIEPANKKINEIRGTVISDYQNYLEKQWLEELKGKYNVEINKKTLKSIYREFEKS